MARRDIKKRDSRITGLAAVYFQRGGSMDSFTGRLYTFLPCHLSDKAALAEFDKQCKAVSAQEGVDAFYIEEANLRVADEISERSRRSFQRGYLGTFSFSFHGESEKDTNCVEKNGRVYYTFNKLTQLCVLVIVFSVKEEPVTQFLDRVSREDIKITHEGTPNSDFYQHLRATWMLSVVGKARVCLSSGRTLEESLKPSIFANEMYASNVMESARLLSGFGNGGWNRDISIYDSSKIYSSKTTVLRCDPALDQSPTHAESGEDGSQAHCKALRRDLMLTFIIELLMFREASIKRANLHINNSIEQDDQLNLADISELMGNFKSAILFWDLDIFLYPAAQQLADSLNSKFDIDRALETYHRNQKFLEQRVNLFSAIESEKETKVINYIAVIIFFFEAVRILFAITRSILSEEPISLELVYSGGIALSGTILLFLLILILVRARRLRARSRRQHG